MGFDSLVDAIDLKLLQLPWRQEGNKLILEGMAQATARNLIKKPGVYDRIALLVRQAGAEMAQIRCPGKKNGFPVFAAAALNEDHLHETTMTNHSLLSFTQAPDNFVWFGGIHTPDLRPHIAQMEDSDQPMGLVQPHIDGGVIKTIQWGINRASINLFNFDALSPEDMRAAIQRDTSGDWYPDDLEEKRSLYQQASSNFEQVARIQTKNGWMLVRFHTQRLDFGNLFICQGQQESDLVQSPDLLMAV